MLQFYLSSFLIVTGGSLSHWTRERCHYMIGITIYIFLLMINILITNKLSLGSKIMMISILWIMYGNNFNIIYDIYKTHRTIANISSYKEKNKIRTTILYDMYSKYLKIIFRNKDGLFQTPNFIFFNYVSDRIENCISNVIPKPVAFLARDIINKRFKINQIIPCIETKSKGSYEEVKHKVLEYLQQGYYICAYINESPYIHNWNYGKMRTGLYTMAKELNIPITLVSLDRIYMTPFGTIPRQTFTIEVGETFYVDDVEIAKYKSKLFFKKQSQKFEQQKLLLE